MSIATLSRLGGIALVAAAVAGCNATKETASATAAATCAAQASTLTGTVQGALCTALGNTTLAPANDLIANLLNPNGTLGPVVGLLDQLTNTNGGALGPVTDLLQALLGANDQAGVLTPVIMGLNAVVAALTGGAAPEQIANVLNTLGSNSVGALSALGSSTNPLNTLLAGLNTALTGGNPTGASGLISSVQSTVGNVTTETQLDLVAQIVDGLVDPQAGALAPVTSIVENLTNTEDGALAVLTSVVDALVAKDDAALAPVIMAVNTIVGTLLPTNGAATPQQVVAAVAGVENNVGTLLTTTVGGVASLLQNVLGGLLGGLQQAGANTVSGLSSAAQG